MPKVPVEKNKKRLKTLWFNMRQEPVVYINGKPFSPRDQEQ